MCARAYSPSTPARISTQPRPSTVSQYTSGCDLRYHHSGERPFPSSLAIGAPLRGWRRVYCAPTCFRGPDPVGTRHPLPKTTGGNPHHQGRGRLPARTGEFMTYTQKPDDRARLAGEYEECRRKVASTEEELKRIGAAFVELGKQLQTQPSSLSAQRLIVEKDLAVLWLILPEYLEALQVRETKKAELDSLK